MHGDVAVVELAEASGLRRLPGGRRRPLTATSRGHRRADRGRAGRAAPAGSCSAWAAAPAPTGARAWPPPSARGFLDADGRELPPGGAALRDLVASTRPAWRPPGAAPPSSSRATWTTRCSARTARPGLRPAEGRRRPTTSSPGGGLWPRWTRSYGATSVPDAARPDRAPARRAAPGYAAMALPRRDGRARHQYLLDLLEFDRHVAGARLVITGEGSLDEQTLHGKAPAGWRGPPRAPGCPSSPSPGAACCTGDELRAAGFAAAYAADRPRTRPGPVHGARQARCSNASAGGSRTPGCDDPR